MEALILGIVFGSISYFFIYYVTNKEKRQIELSISENDLSKAPLKYRRKLSQDSFQDELKEVLTKAPYKNPHTNATIAGVGIFLMPFILAIFSALTK